MVYVCLFVERNNVCDRQSLSSFLWLFYFLLIGNKDWAQMYDCFIHPSYFSSMHVRVSHSPEKKFKLIHNPSCFTPKWKKHHLDDRICSVNKQINDYMKPEGQHRPKCAGCSNLFKDFIEVLLSNRNISILWNLNSISGFVFSHCKCWFWIQTAGK